MADEVDQVSGSLRLGDTGKVFAEPWLPAPERRGGGGALPGASPPFAGLLPCLPPAPRACEESEGGRKMEAARRRGSAAQLRCGSRRLRLAEGEMGGVLGVGV